MKVEWKRGPLGEVVSKDGRFLVRADCMGTTRPQGYTLMDAQGKETSHFTQRGAKNHAQDVVDREEKEKTK